MGTRELWDCEPLKVLFENKILTVSDVLSTGDRGQTKQVKSIGDWRHRMNKEKGPRSSGQLSPDYSARRPMVLLSCDSEWMVDEH